MTGEVVWVELVSVCVHRKKMQEERKERETKGD